MTAEWRAAPDRIACSSASRAATGAFTILIGGTSDGRVGPVGE
jgi:hypothetical protein